jgi:hypothetical protein
MAENKRNLVVRWRHDGEYFAGAVDEWEANWQPAQKSAMRFGSVAEFREYIELWFKTPVEDIWPLSDLRFVRLVPRRQP